MANEFVGQKVRFLYPALTVMIHVIDYQQLT